MMEDKLVYIIYLIEELYWADAMKKRQLGCELGGAIIIVTATIILPFGKNATWQGNDSKTPGNNLNTMSPGGAQGAPCRLTNS